MQHHTNGFFRFPVTVYLEDVDQGGVVYHANYLKYAERARAEMLRAGGISHAALMATGAAIVVSRLSIRYLRPLRLEETLEVSSRIRDSAVARITLEQVMIRGSERVAELEVELVYLGPHGRPLRWPDAVRRALTTPGEKRNSCTKRKSAG